MLVDAQAILTQLLYDHALRIRMKAETNESQPNSRSSTAAVTPDTASVVEDEEEDRPSGSVDGASTSASTTAVGTDSAKGKQKAAPESDNKTDTDASKDSKTSNLMGKLNNMVTSDLENIGQGRDLFIPSMFLRAKNILGVLIFC